MSPVNGPDASPEITPLDSAIREYLMRLDAGEAVSPEEFLAAHPEWRDDIQAFLDAGALVRRMAGSLPAIADTATEFKTVNEQRESSSSSQTETNRIEPAAALTGPFPMLLGKYRVLRPIGQGAMGAVYVADDVKLGRKVALKVPLGSVVKQSEQLDRFLREAQASARLRHHNICPVYEVNEIDGIHYIAMAFIDGKPLADLINQKRRFTGKQIAVTVRKIALALDVAHRAGIVHRDLKPANIMIDRDGEPIVMDFGLAREMNSADQIQLTHEGMILGTPAYMSPEQVRSELHRIGPASDVYSLGVMLYELLCGRHPFRGPLMSVLMDVANEHKQPPKPSEIRHTCDPELEAICLRMLSKRLSERYSSMKEVAAALSGFIKAGNTVAEIPVVPVSQPADPVADADGVAGTLEYQAAVPAPAPDQPSELPQPKPQSVGGGRKMLRRLLALGSFGAMVLAGVIIITITNRDGTQSVLSVSDTAKVEVSHKPDVTSPRTVPKPNDRKAAATAAAKVSWYGWPVEAPQPAISPFSADQAKQHQNNWAKYLNVPVEYTNSVGMKFRLVPPGEFIMGSFPEEIETAAKEATQNTLWRALILSEAPAHKVVLTRPIYVGVYEVTQAEYEKAIGSNPSYFSPVGIGKDRVAGLDTSREPVDMVNWADAVSFCSKLSEKENLQPYDLRIGESTALWNGTGYRLLTEAEWEFSCLAGTTTVYWCGDRKEDLQPAAWYGAGINSHPHPVGQLAANPFGLYDVHGNVWEWIEDAPDVSYYHQFKERPAVDPARVTIGEFHSRSTRGGSTSSVASGCRASYRNCSTANERAPELGFRVSLSVDGVRKALKLEGPAIPRPEKKAQTGPASESINFAAERQGAEHVLKAGGTVALNDPKGARIELVNDQLPATEFILREVRLEGAAVTEDTLTLLQACHHLEALHITTTATTSKALADRLASWPRLTVLALAGSSETGPDFDLSGCPGLREFHGPRNMAQEMLQNVVRSCPLLKTLSLKGARGLKAQALASLRYLEDLTCEGDVLTAEGVAALTGIPALQRLTCVSNANDELAGRLSAFGAQLQVLNISSLDDEKSGMTDTGFAQLSQSLRLIELTVSGPKGSPSKAGLMALGSMPDLRSISIRCEDAESILPRADVVEFQRRYPAINLTVGKLVVPALLTWPDDPNGGIAAWELPKDAPAPAIAPFSPEQAKQHQVEWAAYLHQEVETKNSLGMTFRLIPPGEFIYPYPPRELPHVGNIDPSKRSLVRLSKPYLIGASELTIEQFARFVDETGYKTESEMGQGGVSASLLDQFQVEFNREATWRKPGPWPAEPGDPVTQINWKDATAFCRWLSKKEGVTYRLPTEMEWFHAFWAGSEAKWGLTNDQEELINSNGFAASIPLPHTENMRPIHAAGQGKPNAYGLCDMIGNVWELVYAGRNDLRDSNNPAHLIAANDDALALGAGWETAPTVLESLWCNVKVADRWYPTLGFRVLRQIDDVRNVPPLSKPLLRVSGQALSPAAKVCRPTRIPGIRSWSIEPKRHMDFVAAIAHHPTEEILATGEWDGSVRLWNTKGELQQILLGHSSCVTSVRFFDQGKKLLSSDATEDLRIWNTATGALLQVHENCGPVPVALSPDEKTIAVHVLNNLIYLIDVATGTKYYETADDSCLSFAWSPDSRLLATTSGKSAIHIWQVSPWKRIAEVPVDAYLPYLQLDANLAWSPDGKILAFSPLQGKKVYLIDGTTFELLPGLERQTADEGRRPTWSHDGRLIAISSWSGSEIFDCASRKLLYRLPPSPTICWSMDDTKIYSTNGDCFDVATGEQVQQFHWKQAQSPRKTSLSLDGRSIATTDEAGETSVWNAETGQLKAKWPLGSFIAPTWWSPTDQSAVVIKSGLVQFIDPITGAVTRTFPLSSSDVLEAAFSPDGSWLATSGRREDRLCVFDTASGQKKWEVNTQESPAEHVTWSPDGKRIATSHNSTAEIRLWDSKHGSLLNSYTPLTSPDLKPLLGRLQSVTYLQWSSAAPEIFLGNHFTGVTLDLRTEKCQEWGWHTLRGGHADASSLAPNRESRLYQNIWGFTAYAVDSQRHREFLGHLGTNPIWMPDSRRLLISNGSSVQYGYDLVLRRPLGTFCPVSTPNTWLCIGPNGHYRSGFVDQPGDGTNPQALSAVEDFIVYVAQTEDGSQIICTPKEFAEKFGWKNDPSKATLLKLDDR